MNNKELDALENLYHNIGNSTENYLIVKSALEDLEWLKTKLDLDFMNRLSVPEDKIRLLKIMGWEVEIHE